jgi:large subunit ribosomal protein L17
MRHRVAGYKLGRDTEHRTAMFRNLAASLFIHGQITTTIPKAKAVKPFVEKLITLAKRGDLASRRLVIARLRDRIMVRNDKDEDAERNRFGELVGGPKLVKKLFDEIAPKYADREGGYTRIIKLTNYRIGDGGQLCVLQLVGDEEGPQVSGQFSRRREKANRRTAFAAKLRKARGGAASGGGGTAVAEEEAPAVEASAEAEAPQQEAGGEGEVEKKEE